MQFIAFVTSKDVNGTFSYCAAGAPSNVKSTPNPKIANDLPTTHLSQTHVVETSEALAWCRQHASPGTFVIVTARPGRAVIGLDAVRLGALPGVSVGIVAAARAGRTAAGSDGSLRLVVGRSDAADEAV